MRFGIKAITVCIEDFEIVHRHLLQLAFEIFPQDGTCYDVGTFNRPELSVRTDSNGQFLDL